MKAVIPDTAQTLTLRTFTILHTLRQNWGGSLILSCGLNPEGAALALASNIAGAVCLSIEEDPKTLKDALRSGSCDFIVNTLDEALRTMKNEVRKHLPLSVGLQGNPSAVLEELLARGVSPELFMDFTPNPNQDPPHIEPTRRFKSQGATILSFSNTPSIEGEIDANALLNTLTQTNQWRLYTFPFETLAARRAFDTQALALIPAEDHLRRRWLQAAPGILQRERPIHRTLWLTEQENRTLETSPQNLTP
jgi:hypothetical protein